MYPSDDVTTRLAMMREKVRHLQRRAQDLLDQTRERLGAAESTPWQPRPPDPLPPLDEARRNADDAAGD